MTISGAAVSPNSGYHSSPLTAFVMTLFNVRLGAWLPNPAANNTADDMDLAMPDRSLRSLAGDLLGMAGDTGKSIYLSDGGHFDNLGIYEMVRRRCRYILVVDAGQDEKCTFEDLGNALRKAALDMSVGVSFPKKMMIFPRTSGDISNALGYAAGTIIYPGSLDPGVIIYMKPTLLYNVPKDVLAFSNLDQSFPHDLTADQFFNESRFESYRALGEFQMSALIGRLTETMTLAQFFTQAGALPDPAETAADPPIAQPRPE